MSSELIKSLLEDILESINIVLERTEKIKSHVDLVKDEKQLLLFDSIAMRLQIIGELIKSIQKRDRKFLEKDKSIEWNNISRLRDKISHHYADLDAEVIYNICKKNIPQLKKSVEKIIKNL
jgi:uncharacterized protein with HEPN domain